MLRSGFARWPMAVLLPLGAFVHLAADIAGLPVVDVVEFVIFGAGFIALGARLTRLHPDRQSAQPLTT